MFIANYLYILVLIAFIANCKKQYPQDSEAQFRTFLNTKCAIYDSNGKMLEAAKREYEIRYKPDGFTVEEFEASLCDGFENTPYLIKTVHKDSSWYTPDNVAKAGWLIAYGFDDSCHYQPEEKEELTKAIGRALRLWLAPLKPPLVDKEVVDNFYYREVAVQTKKTEYEDAYNYEFDLGSLNGRQPHLKFVFHCNDDIGSHFDPDHFYVSMSHREANAEHESLLLCSTNYVKHTSCEQAGYTSGGYSLVTLVHEVGHAFALADTYAGRPAVKDGQPISVMTNYGAFYTKDSKVPLEESLVLGEDDERGIEFIYSYAHKGAQADDCLSSDYEYVGYTVLGGIYEIGDCRPKNPLIFRIKQAWLQEHNHNNPNMAAIMIDASVYSLSGAFFVEKNDQEIIYANRLSETDRRHKKFVAEKVNAKDDLGNSALHYTIIHGAQSQQLRTQWLELLATLMKINACPTQQSNTNCLAINVQNVKGKTPLHIAVEQNYLEAVKMLLAKGADRQVKDNDNKTAIDYAQQEEIKLLLQ